MHTRHLFVSPLCFLLITSLAAAAEQAVPAAAQAKPVTDKWEKDPTKEDEFVVDYVRVYEGTLPTPNPKPALPPEVNPGAGTPKP